MTMSRKIWPALALITGAIIPGIATAQVGAFGGYYSSGVDQFNYVLNRIQMQNIMANAEKRAGRGPAPDKPVPEAPAKATASPIITLGAQPVAPQMLARHYPADQQAAAAKTFREVLDGYHQLSGRLGIAKGDMAGAMTALIAGSWSACRDRDIPDAGFVRAARQLGGAIGQDPRFAQVSAADKQSTYEQFAILGTNLALTRMALQRQPDPAVKARMCEAARGYLRQFDLVPEQIEITPQGLALD